MFESAHAPGMLHVGLDEIGIACRYKSGPFARSAAGDRHADAILPGGVPMGFFPRTRRDRRRAFTAPGLVRDAAALLRERPEYMLAGEARARRCTTTFCLIRIGESRAADFAEAWAEIAEAPPRFWAWGGTCAQVLTETLIRVGAMPRPLFRPGNPDALFSALHAARPEARIAVGYAEFLAEGRGIRLEG